MKQRRTPTRRAFTLIETVISLSIMTVLMLGLSSAVLIGSKALPSATQTGLNDQKVIDALNQLRSELRQAVHVHFNWTATDLHLHLTMDQARTKGTPEKIEYHYRIPAKTFTRMYKEGKVLGTEYILFDGVSNGAFKVTPDGADLSNIWLLFNVDNTKQQLFEAHMAVPNTPVLEIKSGSK